MKVSAATKLAATLKHTNKKVVLAESCTGGRAAALLTLEPGVSAHFCGSAITYQESVKSAWLGVDEELIEVHTAESPETTVAMAIGILQRTESADWSIAVTGHFGPGAPPEKDGIIFLATARRLEQSQETRWQQFQLTSDSRCDRQLEAAELTLEFLLQGILKTS
jgi:nicotinamide-nucleotide amidase